MEGSENRKRKREKEEMCVKEGANCETYFESPDEYHGNAPSIFLAGGISGCPDWQKEAKEGLEKQCEGLVIINPRRAKFDVSDKSIERQQITWEHQHLRKASSVLFWFPKHTLCPITLYELGVWTTHYEYTRKVIFIGVDPEYQRKSDVKIQTELVAPELKVVESLDELLKQVAGWYRSLRD